ncbi:MAG: hypothetical protein D6734_12460 [Candidatus Schekmanbacteria bacterium]|nr:MAG: hypothetical protein D6734_12460 [Candidatus Schekmanbacteria bacterium]
MIVINSAKRLFKERFKVDKERRKYFRVKTVVPLKYKLASDEINPKKNNSNLQDLFHNLNISTESYDEHPVPFFEKEILLLLKQIDNKLNFLIKGLKLKGGEELCPGEPTEITLSGNGLSFPSKTAFKEGDQLELEISLPDEFTAPLILIAKVKNCKKENNKDYKISAEFMNILPSQEERIVKYTIACQREIIKKS